MADDIIASGDASVFPPSGESREFLTTGETLCRLSSAPSVASLHFNPAAPASSLHALAIARSIGAVGIIEVVLELTLPTVAAQALEAARDAIDEARLVLEEMQRREGDSRKGGAQ